MQNDVLGSLALLGYNERSITVRKASLSVGLVLACLGAEGFAADDINQRVSVFLQGKVREWMANPIVVDAVRAQNQKHGVLTIVEINRLDNEWKTEAPKGAGALISAVADNEVSEYLRNVKDSNAAVITELFVMDNRGLNVGVADLTSDYWQGDEAKWQQTYSVGPTGLFIDKPKFDESSGATQVQGSMTLVDPKTQEAIGAVTVGVNVKALP